MDPLTVALAMLAAYAATRPRETRATLGQLEARPLPLLATIRPPPKADGVPIFRGWPSGWKQHAVPVWARRPSGANAGGWEPRPDRFEQWQPLARPDLTAAQYSKWFQDRYWFGVSEGTSLEFYVLGTLTGRRCCSVASKTTTTTTTDRGKLKHTETVERRGVSGRPVLGTGWVCEGAPAQCYTIRPRPATFHPTIRS